MKMSLEFINIYIYINIIMLIKIIAFIIFFILNISYSQLMCLPYYLIGNSRKGGDIAKQHLHWTLNPIYQIAFNSPIYYTGNYNKTNNIDILVANHVSSLDFLLLVSIIKQFENRNIYSIIKKELVLVPGLGFLLISAPDIKLNRHMDEDEDNIINTVKKIKSGIIFIFPEGTRYTPDKHELALKYSSDNNLYSFKNTLYPKMKGLWLVYKTLINENRMGKIIDVTTIVENFRHKKAQMEALLTTDMGNTLCILNTYTVPSIPTYDIFKKWFLDIWIIKDNLLTNMYSPNDTHLYSKLSRKSDNSDYIIAIIIASIFIVLIIKTKGRYLIGTLLVTYIITFIKYKLLKKVKI